MPSKEKTDKKADKSSEKPKKDTKKKEAPKKDSTKKAPAKKKSHAAREIAGDTLKKLIAAKDSLSPLGKLKLLKLLLLIKEGELKVGKAAEGSLTEDEVGERNPIAKVEKTSGELESYAAQRPRIEFTDKELQSIIGFKDQAQPTQQDKFVVKYQTSDPDGANITTIVQKEREGQVFNFVAYGKKENSNNQGLPGDAPEPADDGGDDTGDDEGGMPDLGSLKENEDPNQPQEITADEDIVITKSITFSDDTQSADVLSDFLRALEL